MVKVFNKFFLIALIATVGFEQKISLANLETASQVSRFVESSSGLKNQASKYPLTDLAVLKNAFINRLSNIQVLILGRVVSVLPDDTNGDRHQRFIVKLSNSQTLLITHNIDIAPRINDLRVGDQLYIYGEYEWNSKGGVIHWTHHDPNRRHLDGWIERNGVSFR
jgi:hypothetical protein